MKPELYVRNQQHTCPIDRRLLCRIVRSFLGDDLACEQYMLAIYLVDESRITELNEAHLHHAGPTDVITFDYTIESGQPDSASLVGDIFICVPEAVRQSAKYHTSWQSEVIRYIVHGILHLRGYDDQTAHARKKMKREEDRLLRKLAARFNFKQELG